MRFKIARKLGADEIVNASHEDVVKRVRDLTGGLGADIVVETANSPSVLSSAIDMAAAQGSGCSFRPLSRGNDQPREPLEERAYSFRRCGIGSTPVCTGHEVGGM